MLNIKAAHPAYHPTQDDTPFTDLGIDSFDMMALRVTVEQHVGHEIADTDWLSFRSYGDVHRYCARARIGDRGTTQRGSASQLRRVHVNMPQMAVGGLSEGWLFRELGDLHWTMLCDALGTASHDIADAAGRRLYATFVRITLKGTHHLKRVCENDDLTLTGHLSRYGASVWFSEVSIAGPHYSFQARLMSTFAAREGGNTTLLRGEPTIPAECSARVHAEMPHFMAEYRTRRAAASLLRVGAPVGEAVYTLNPYTDFNGVNLLYFASYPLIHDTIERHVIHAQRDSSVVATDWAEGSATIERDICYYANCAISDAVTVRIDECARDAGTMRVHSHLRRASDGAPMAEIIAVKAIL